MHINGGAMKNLTYRIRDPQIQKNFDDVNARVNSLETQTSDFAKLSKDNTFTGENNFTNKITGQDPSTPDELVTKRYVDLAVAGMNVKFYMTDSTDAGTGYYLTQIDPPADPETYFEYTSVTNDQLLASWISPSGYDFSSLVAGLYEISIACQKTGGKKNIQLYWEMYERDSGGNETLIGTSYVSDEIGTTKTKVFPSLLLQNDYEVSAGSRIVGKIYARVSGNGPAPTLRIYIEGTTNSGWQLPINTKFLSGIYVENTGSSGYTYVYLSSNYSISAPTNFTIPFDTIDVDDGNFDTSTYQWTAPYDCLVFADLTIRLNNTYNFVGYGRIRRNGAFMCNVPLTNSSGDGGQAVAMFFVNTGDTINFEFRLANGSVTIMGGERYYTTARIVVVRKL